MAEDAGNNQNVDPSSTPSGPSAPDITLDQARVLALHTADLDRSTISRAYRRSPLVFAIEYEEENETHFLITIRFQPEGEFGGLRVWKRYPSTKMEWSNPEGFSANPYRINPDCPYYR